MDKKQQPEALRLANVCSNLTRYSMDAHLIAAELRRQHARITELESQLAQRFAAADMATAAAQGFRDGVASVSAGSEPAPVPPPECETEAEKRAFAFGWFKALESERMKADNKKKDPL